MTFVYILQLKTITLRKCFWFAESSSSCQRSPFGLQPKGSFMDVEVKHGVQNPAQEANIVHLLKKFSGFYGAQKLQCHAGLPLVPIPSQISLFYNPIPFFLYAL
jgi:hypothetical protein